MVELAYYHLCLITASGNGDCSHTAMRRLNCLFKCLKQRSDKKSSTQKKKKKKAVGFLRRPHVSCHTPTRRGNPPQEINGSPRGPNVLGLPVVSISHYQALYTGSDRRHSGIRGVAALLRHSLIRRVDHARDVFVII